LAVAAASPPCARPSDSPAVLVGAFRLRKELLQRDLVVAGVEHRYRYLQAHPTFWAVHANALRIDETGRYLIGEDVAIYFCPDRARCIWKLGSICSSMASAASSSAVAPRLSPVSILDAART